MDLLIRAGADTTLVDRNGYTAAHLAVLYGRDDCLKNLLKYLRPGVSSKQPFPELNLRCYDGRYLTSFDMSDLKILNLKVFAWNYF